MRYIMLDNGVKMLQIGYGTYLTQLMYEYLQLSMDKTVLRTIYIAPDGACDPMLSAEDFWKFYTERKECEIVC